MWMAVGSHGGKILTAGHNSTRERLEYLLVDGENMKALDRVTVTEKVERGKESGVRLIKLTIISGKLIAVCCRACRYVDILEVAGTKIKSDNSLRAIDLAGDVNFQICCICQHTASKNLFLFGGTNWTKTLKLTSI